MNVHDRRVARRNNCFNVGDLSSSAIVRSDSRHPLAFLTTVCSRKLVIQVGSGSFSHKLTYSWTSCGVAPLLAFEKKFFCIDFMLTNAVNGGSANANFANIASTQLCFLFNAS